MESAEVTLFLFAEEGLRAENRPSLTFICTEDGAVSAFAYSGIFLLRNEHILPVHELVRHMHR